MSQLITETPPTSTDRTLTNPASDTPGHPRLGRLWQRLRSTAGEMNYATRRLLELQMRLP